MAKDISTPMGRILAWLDMHVVDHGFVRAIYNNFHDLGGGMYRSSQPSPAQIRRYHRKYGLKTILNLRGESEFGSYVLERQVCEELGIVFIDAKLFSRGAPSRARIHMLKDLFASIEYPALMHCKSGADRAGIAAALYRLLHLGHPVADTMNELHWRYGHSRKARTGVLDFFLASYAAYNEKTPIDFMEWVDTVYDDEALKQQFRSDGWSSLIVDKVLHRE